MSRMDQEDAAVLAAGLGIAGTLAGALGGALIAARAALRQVAVQEEADARLRLRDERREGCLAVLAAADAFDHALLQVYVMRTEGNWENPDSVVPLANAAFQDLRRAVRYLEITGPDELATAAGNLRSLAWDRLSAMTDEALTDGARSERLHGAIERAQAADEAYLAAVRRALGPRRTQA